MKRLKSVWLVIFLVMLCAQMTTAFALDEDDPYEELPEETTTAVIVSETTTTAATLPYITLPVDTTTQTTAEIATPAPTVYITRSDLPHTPACGGSCTITVLFHNYSSIPIKQGLAVFEPGDGLTLEEKSDTKVVPPIDASGVARLSLRLRVAKENTATQIPVQVTYSYSYLSAQEIVNASAAEKLIVPVQKAADEQKDGAAGSTPNILISRYDYGGEIAAGDDFTLSLVFTNTSTATAVENIVMSVDTGSGISITGASNTYYYPKLAAGKSASQTIPMRVLTTADAQGADVAISFRYEYVDKDTRSSASANENLSIPIYVPDRFQLSQPDQALFGMQNEELPISVNYINKGRGEVSNVHAQLVYDEDTALCEQPQLNLGNFEPGRNGSIDFYITPTEVGKGEVSVIVTYEDALTHEKTLTVRIPYEVQASYMGFDDFSGEPLEEEPAAPSPLRWVWIVGIPVLVVMAAVIVIVIIRRRKKKAAAEAADFDWGFAPEAEERHDENR